MPPHTEHQGSPRAWWGVLVLTLVYVIALADRQILALLVQPIAADLGLTRDDLALLHGLAFALLYTTLGIPLAVLADRRSRRGLIAAGLAFWSAMTALCGLATGYTQLFLARLGVGVGEAALSPAAYSWIAASFPRAALARALGLYSTGIYLGSGLSFVLGGSVVAWVEGGGAAELPLLGALRAWQVPFAVLGMLGLACVPLLFLLREPARPQRPLAGAQPGFRALFALLRGEARLFAGHHLGVACLSLSGYAFNFWTPTLLVEQHGWTRAQAGVGYGLILGLAGAAGALAGGAWADRRRARGRPRASLEVGWIATLATAPCALAFPLLGALAPAFCASALLSFCTGVGFGVAPATVQERVPAELRGRASALYLFVINLVGGLGSWLVARCAALAFDGALGPALASVGVLAALAGAGSLWWGARARTTVA